MTCQPHALLDKHSRAYIVIQIQAIHGVQEAIKASKEWFMACEPHAAGMAAQMAEFLSHAPTHEQRLHVLYLANDVLLKG